MLFFLQPFSKRSAGNLLMKLNLKQYPNATFWLLFFALNCLLFLPLYLAFREGSTLWPSFAYEVGDGSLRWYTLKFFVIRQNADIFRLSVEWVVLIAAWVWLPAIRKPAVRRTLIGLFIFGIVYNTYDTLIFAFYNEYPNFYDDTLLLINGFEGLTRHIGIPTYVYVLALGGIILFFTACVFMIRQLLAEERISKLNRFSHLMLFLMLAYSAVMIWEYAVFMGHPRIGVSSLTAKINGNRKKSVTTYQYQQLLLEASDLLPNVYDYSDFPLSEKPDIYVIAIESYGDALYQFDEMRGVYLDRLAEIDGRLQQEDWQSASVRSEAPIRGGKSWLSYTSLLFGLRVDDEAQYDVLVNEFQDRSYPHLGNYLQKQGYDYQRVTPLMKVERDEPEWERARRFYGFDRWIFLNDMVDFAGPVYGWGPSPADQYSLSFMRDVVETAAPDTPHLYFYITHNSHVPWVEPPSLAADWRDLAEPQANQSPAYSPDYETKEAYLKAIVYQVEMVTSVILNGPDDASYIVMGDHQPPLLAFSDYEGTATPLHVITKNQEMIDALVGEGLRPGLVLGENTIKHEGFYSLFMRGLLTSYADFAPDELPEVLPDGIDLELLVEGERD
jgi:hypothetical protein